MKNYIYLLIILLCFSCNKQKQRERRLYRELEQGNANSENFALLFTDSIKILSSKSSRKLNNTAFLIYSHIGIPLYKQDTVRLNFALRCLDKSLKIEPSNKSAYQNKINILGSLQDWDRIPIEIENWLKQNDTTYYDLMLKGFAYEMANKPNSSQNCFTQALKVYDINVNTKRDKDLFQRIVIMAFIGGEAIALKELDKLINETNSQFLRQTKDVTFADFNRKKYIETNVFVAKQELILSN